MANVIELNNISESYRILSVVNGKKSWKDFWALKDVNFCVKRGEIVGIIGENGVGKTTILKIIAGILKPDKGEVNVIGSVAGLLEIGAGFENELTGYDNIFFHAAMLGMSKTQTIAQLNSIIEFADIGDFLYVPVKCYSQGMFVRLAFAIAVHIDPDILLIDDTFAVGDEEFQQKSMNKIMEFRNQGKTIVFVSHNMDIVTNFGERAILLQDGKVIQDDAASKTVLYYIETVGKKEGIGVLKNKGPLRVIFNNGKIVVNWDGRVLTKGDGLCFSFHYQNRDYYSTQLNWHLEEQKDTSFIFIGEKKNWNIRLKILINFDTSNNLNINAEIFDTSCLDSKLYLKFNFLGDIAYDQWISMNSRGNFETISPEDTKPVNFFQIEGSYSHLGMRAKTGKRLFPFMFFEISDESRGLISNSEYQRHSRIIQFLNLNNVNKSQIKVSFLTAGIRQCASRRREKMLFDKKKREETILQNGQVKLLLDRNKLRLFWGKAELTGNSGIYGAISIDGYIHNSSYAEWKIIESNNHLFVFSIKHHGLDIEEVWYLTVNALFEINISISIKSQRIVNIESYLINIMLRSQYTNWFTVKEEGVFPEIFYKEDCFDVLQKEIVAEKVALSVSDSKLFPDMVLDTNDGVIKIYNSEEKYSARVIRLIHYFTEKRKQKDINNVLLNFNVKIICGVGPKKLNNFFVQRKIDFINNKVIKIMFYQDRLRIFLKDEELTKNLCLYTAFRSKGRWEQGRLKVKKGGDNFLLLENRFLSFPIIELWAISLKGNSIVLNIEHIISDTIEVDRFQVNVMFKDCYYKWFATKGINGVFLPFKKDIDDDWDIIYSCDKKDDYVGIELADNVKVLFSGTIQKLSRVLNIVNSNFYHRARVLQVLSKERKVLNPGKYHLFSGEINFDI